MKLNKVIKNPATLCFLVSLQFALPIKSALSYSVCALQKTIAAFLVRVPKAGKREPGKKDGRLRPRTAFKTTQYLITICPREASYHMIKTFLDGTGYQRIPVQRQGNRYYGSDDKHNYIIDGKIFIIGTDGEQPVRQPVIQSS